MAKKRSRGGNILWIEILCLYNQYDGYFIPNYKNAISVCMDLEKDLIISWYHGLSEYSGFRSQHLNDFIFHPNIKAKGVGDKNGGRLGRVLL